MYVIRLNFQGIISWRQGSDWVMLESEKAETSHVSLVGLGPFHLSCIVGHHFFLLFSPF